MRNTRPLIPVFALLFCGAVASGWSEEQKRFQPGQRIEIEFNAAELPPTLYSLMNETRVKPCLTYRLPDDYSPTNHYPLAVYVPGNDGGMKGNIHNAETLAPSRGWIAATLPLFKKTIDRAEPAGGVIVSYEDYPVITQAYTVILGRLFQEIPNIDKKRSAMVGFSNGAITLAVLLSNHDPFVLNHFRQFCIVDHGMFHLSDLHKSLARDCRFLILVGDQEGLGREVKIKQSQLQQEAWSLLKVDVSYRVLKNTGHEFNEPQMAVVREWLESYPTR